MCDALFETIKAMLTFCFTGKKALFTIASQILSTHELGRLKGSHTMQKKLILIGLGVCLIMLLSALINCSKNVAKLQPTTEVEKKQPVQAPLPKIPDVEEKQKEVKVVEETPVKLSLRDVNFDFDKSDLRSDAREILAEHARKLQQNPKVKVMIEGHCDERGTIEYNLALGERRAFAVKMYLVNYGIDAARLSTISYGKERPLDNRSNEQAWAKNRRAAFVVKDN
jgi:peptidoglycan-associated lipoprotein